MTVLGALLGLVAALGVLIAVRAAPPLRPVRLVDRIAPYLADSAPPSRLLAPSAPAPLPPMKPPCCLPRLNWPPLALVTSMHDGRCRSIPTARGHWLDRT